MQVKDNEVVEYLAQNYGSSIAKRALWSWGGGVEKDVDYDLLPWDSWKLMWDKAGKTAIPTRISLVREMLFDIPGEKALLRYLDALAEERFKAEKEIAEFFLFLLKKTGGEENRLEPLLFLFQDMPRDCVLVTIAPAIQGTFDNNFRAILEKDFTKIGGKRIEVSSRTLLNWIEFYLDHLTGDTPGMPAILEEVRQIKENIAKLQAINPDVEGPEKAAPSESVSTGEDLPVENKPLDSRAANSEADNEGTDKTLGSEGVFEKTAQKLGSHIEGLKEVLPESGGDYFKPAVKVVESLFELMKECGLKEKRSDFRLSAAKTVSEALWATRGY